jgi:glycine receptor alpha-3
MQIYIPSSLIVILSWVSFWLDRSSAPARVSLGMTCQLTMVKIFANNIKYKSVLFFNNKVTFIWSTNASLPKISYIKSIDIYLVFCFLMTFLSIIEYGVVCAVNRYCERIKRKSNDLNRKKYSLTASNTSIMNNLQ